MREKNIIWTNFDLDLEEWAGYLGLESKEDTYAEYDMMCKYNNEYLEDERANLSYKLNKPILCIEDLGLWDGRHTSYRIIDSGNIADCLYTDCEYAEWYVDSRGDLRADTIHHDGTNHILYRVFRNKVDVDNFIEKLSRKEISVSQIDEYTRRIGDIIANIYGWDIKR